MADQDHKPQYANDSMTTAHLGRGLREVEVRKSLTTAQLGRGLEAARQQQAPTQGTSQPTGSTPSKTSSPTKG